MFTYSNEIKNGCCGFRKGKEQYFKDFGVVEIQKNIL